MNILLISTDRKVLDENSDVRNRMLMLSEAFDDLRILLVSKKNFSNQIHSRDGLCIYEISFWKAFFWKPDFSPDFVTTQDPFENGLLGWVISRKINKPLQLQVHTDFLSEYFKKESLKNKLRVLLAKFLLSRATKIRVVSERIKKSLTSTFSLKPLTLSVLPVFIDREALLKQPIGFSLREKFHEFKKIVITVSRLEKEKNIDLVIKAFKKVLEQEPKAGLIICGDGSLKKDLERLVQNLNLEKTVKFLGWVTETASLYKTADVLVVASSYEGYGMNMVEASVFGLPIVATDVGVAKELGANIATLDEKELSTKILESLNNHVNNENYKTLYTKEDYIKAYKMSFEKREL